MQCAKHPEHEAAGMCAYSGKPFCSHELVEVQGRMYGKDYLDRVFAEAKEAVKPQQPMVFMNAGGGGAAASSSAAAAGAGIVVQKKPVNHIFHLIMTLITFGLWLPIWLIRAC
jgi:hypothetical protein